ncbi:MAG: polysaccharide deacetylase family protein [Victivallales bacterium]|nr:polysaccharide deacetylase family protein [Victivallales bacterium]
MPVPDGKDAMLAITFDDGIKSHYDIAVPVLEKHGIKATFFVTINNIGKPGRITWEQVQDMQKRGMEIGNHAMTHAHLGKTLINTKGLNPEIDKIKIQQIQKKNHDLMLFELIAPKKIFEDHGITIRTLAFAGNSRPREAVKLTKENGMLPRVFETGYYSKDDEKSHAKKLDKILKKGNYTILMIHGVAEGTGGWSPLRNLEFFENIIADFTKHSDRLYIDTMAETSSYRERAENSTLTELKNNEYRLDLKNPDTISGAGKVTLALNGTYKVFVNGQEISMSGTFFNASTGDVIRLAPMKETAPEAP